MYLDDPEHPMHCKCSQISQGAFMNGQRLCEACQHEKAFLKHLKQLNSETENE